MTDLPVSNQLPTQDIIKPEIKPRKKRVLTEAQKKIMLENLSKGREKAHILRRQMEADRKKLSEIPKETPKEITKEIPKEIKQEIPKEITKEIPKEIKQDIKPEIIKPERVVVKPKQKSYYNRRVIYEQEETDSDNDAPVVVRRVRKNKTPPPPPPKPLVRDIARDNQRKKIMNSFFS